MRLFEAGQLVGLEVYENSRQARMAYDYQEPAVQAAEQMQQSFVEAPAQEPTQENTIDRLADIGMDVQIKEN